MSDFGLAKTKEHTKTQTVANSLGTVPWTAPEYLTAKRIKERSEKGDVFSFGVIIWELVVRQTPWKESGMSLEDIKEVVVEGSRLDIPSDCPQHLKVIMNECWENGLFEIECFY